MRLRAVNVFHPAVLFVYMLSLLIVSMLFFHPVFIVVGIFFAILQNVIANGVNALFRQLKWSIPMCLIVAAFNPIINSGGKTVLFYFFGNPVTMEASIYGACSGGMLLLIFLWFAVYNQVVTPDKFLFLFSKLAPAVSMIIVMTQRMIPLFAERVKMISATQKTLFPSPEKKQYRKKLKNAFDQISILLSWSMEDGLDTADSMKARGYGLKKRSTFSIYHFTTLDFAALFADILLLAVCVAAFYRFSHIYFFPRVEVIFNPGTFDSLAAYCILAAALPLIELRYLLFLISHSKNFPAS